MSLSIIKENGTLIGSHQSYVELPILYVVHKESSGGDFKISLYYEKYIGGNLDDRSVNSDIPFATWKPGRGLVTINFSSTLLREAGLWPELEAFCERAYAAWQKNQAREEEEAETPAKNNVNDALALAKRLREQQAERQASASKKKKKKKQR